MWAYLQKQAYVAYKWRLKKELNKNKHLTLRSHEANCISRIPKPKGQIHFQLIVTQTINLIPRKWVPCVNITYIQ